MLAQKLKELREIRRMSQAELAGVLDVAQQTVASWERGKSSPNYDLLQKLADYFHVSTDYLLGHKTTPNDMKSILFQTPNGKASPERLAIMEMIPHIPNDKLPMARSLMEVLTKEDYDNMA